MSYPKNIIFLFIINNINIHRVRVRVIFVSIVVFGTMPYFVFVFVLVPGYEQKTQQTASKNKLRLKNLEILP